MRLIEPVQLLVVCLDRPSRVFLLQLDLLSNLARRPRLTPLDSVVCHHGSIDEVGPATAQVGICSVLRLQLLVSIFRGFLATSCGASLETLLHGGSLCIGAQHRELGQGG